MSGCSSFCIGLVTLIVDAFEQQLEVGQNSRPSTPIARGEALLTFHAKCSSAGSFIVLPSEIEGLRPDSPVIPVQMFVESYDNQSDFIVEIQPTLNCNERVGHIPANSSEEPREIIYDTTERLGTAKRYGLSADDTEKVLRNSSSRYDGEQREFYIDDTHSIAKFVEDKGFPHGTISSSTSGFGSSSQLIVYSIDQTVLDTSVKILSEASKAIQFVELDKLALVFNLFGEDGSLGEFECKIRVAFVSGW